MPLDGHDFLVAQGWSGKGTGLRQGAISRPLAIPQKKNLAGLGKDRDEAFPFWDHLFNAAAKSIQLKFASDDESDEDPSLVEIKRTTTGIISNRRPVIGISATTSGTNTPDVSDDNPRLTLLSIAKRDAAHSSLYARFFRGPVLGPDDDLPTSTPTPSSSIAGAQSNETNARATGEKKGGEDDAGNSTTKRKRGSEDSDPARLQRKKERKEQKAKEKEERRARRRDRRAACEHEGNPASEELEIKENKRRKRERKEEKRRQSIGDKSTLKEESKKKHKRTKKGDDSKDRDCGCALVHTLASTIDSDTIEATPIGQQLSSEPPEHKKKKKRKREDV
ncbi:hypothetical protein DXG01_011967 [Tephrocybe rancida]|nr:hypothetical protein DXG01_011967 [Tephrocybe rancida]